MIKAKIQARKDLQVILPAHKRALKDYIDSANKIVVKDPIDWIEKNVSTSGSVASAEKGYVKFDPHQKPIAEAIFDEETREIITVGVQQAGKSFSWQAGLTCQTANGGVTAYVVYESDDKAEKINRDIIKPLLKSIPKLRKFLERPGSYNNSAFRFPDSTVYYTGSGGEISSFPVKYGIASETDRWDGTLKTQRHTLNTLKHRLRRYEVLGKSKFIAESSPSDEYGVIWELFKTTDQSYWNLRCLDCGLLMPSNRIAGWMIEGEWRGGLKYEKDASGNIDYNTLALECRGCGKRHTEKQSREMNFEGEYVSKFPNNTIKKGFQFGALCGFRSIAWRVIADAFQKQEDSGERVDQVDYDTSIRGMPYKPKRQAKKGLDILSQHCEPLPDGKDLSMVFFSADTQDSHFVYVVRGMDKAGNTYLLDKGMPRTREALENAWNKNYLGMLPTLGVIDEGGHRADEVQQIIDDDPSGGLYSYKGARLQNVNWEYGKRDDRLLRGNAHYYKALLLHQIYSQLKKSKAFWYLPPFETLDEDYINHMLAPRPPKKKPNADYSLWKSGEHDDIKDDYFDAEKMLLMMIDFAKEILPLGSWAHEMPWQKDLIENKIQPTAKIKDL